MQHLAGIDVHDFALGREVMDLVNDQVTRAARVLEQCRGEFDEEPGALTNHPAAQVDERWPVAGGHELGHGRAGVSVDRHVGVLAAKDDYGVTRSLAVSRRLNSPPISLWVDDRDWSSIVEQALH